MLFSSLFNNLLLIKLMYLNNFYFIQNDEDDIKNLKKKYGKNCAGCRP